MDRKLLELALKKGWNPSKLSAAQLTALNLEVRSLGELIKDGAKAAASIAQTAINLNVVSEEKAQSNEATCRTCEKFTTLDNGKPACLACGCSGTGITAKWKDKGQSCPLGHWTNA